MAICKYLMHSPVGNLTVIEKNGKLIGIRFSKEEGCREHESDFFKEVKKQLEEYFRGERKEFSIAVELEGTDFRMKVWEELKNIKYGETVSYSDLAKRIGNKKAARAVGSACNKNPVPIVVPCHRVIGKNGNITGYAGGEKIKKALLDVEGVIAKNDKNLADRHIIG